MTVKISTKNRCARWCTGRKALEVPAASSLFSLAADPAGTTRVGSFSSLRGGKKSCSELDMKSPRGIINKMLNLKCLF